MYPFSWRGCSEENEKKKKETLWPCRQVQLGNGQIIMIVNQIDGTKRPALSSLGKIKRDDPPPPHHQPPPESRDFASFRVRRGNWDFAPIPTRGKSMNKKTEKISCRKN
jgi:hypothetical protein